MTEYSCRPAEGDCSSAKRTAAIWLVVSVPVLSLQMTVVHPRVSTEGRLQTTQLRAQIMHHIRFVGSGDCQQTSFQQSCQTDH